MNSDAGKLAGYRLLFYNDAKTLGGHEIQSLHALRWMLREGAQVTCYCRESNHALRESLEKAAEEGQLKIVPLTLPRIRFHRLYHFFRPGLVRDLAERFRAENPHAVFIVQGNLEISAVGALAARQASIPSLSYIALAQSFVRMRANRPRRRDFFNGYLATVPDRWLTISEAMRKRLRQRGARQPIKLIPNCVTLPQPPDKTAARRALGLAEQACVLGMAGRLDANQKGSDIFLDALAKIPSGHPLAACHLLFLGDGPARESLISRCENLGWKGRIHWQPWTESPEQVYPAYDLLVMPSRFEGLPITMQEALLCGVPVAASNVDGLGEFLPAEWTCPREKPEALFALLSHFAADPEAYRAPLPQLAECVRTEHNFAAFEAVLAASLGSLLAEKDIAPGR